MTPSDWFNVTGTRSRERAGGTPAVQSKSAIADFDCVIEWPKPAYTRFRLALLPKSCPADTDEWKNSVARSWKYRGSLHERRRRAAGVHLHRQWGAHRVDRPRTRPADPFLAPPHRP